METAVDVAEKTGVDVGVYLRGGDIGVAQELLQRTHVGAALEHMRREAVPQNVRRYTLRRDSDRRRSLSDDLENPLPGERTSETGHENVPLKAVAAHESLARRVEIRRKRPARRRSDRQHPLLRAFAENPQKLPFGENIVEFQSARFRNPQSAAVHHLQQRPVAQLSRLRTVHRVDHREHLGFGKRFRQGSAFLLRLHPLGRIRRDNPPVLHISEPGAYRRRPPRPGGGAHPAFTLPGEKSDDVVLGHVFSRFTPSAAQKRREKPEIARVRDAGVAAFAPFELKRFKKERYLRVDQ